MYSYVLVFRHNSDKTVTIDLEKDMTQELKTAWENSAKLTINIDNEGTLMVDMSDVIVINTSII